MTPQAVRMKRQKARRDAVACEALAGGNPTVAFTLPADAKLYARSDHVLDSSVDYAIVLNGVNRPAPDLDQNAVDASTLFPLGYYRKGSTIQALAGITLYFDAGLGRLVAIGGTA